MIALPWGDLGVSVKRNEKPLDVLVRAKLDWRVTKQPVFAIVNEQRVEIPGRFALLKDDDGSALSIVSADWTPMQNSDTLVVFNDVARAVGGRLEYVGRLKGGKMMWGLVSTDSECEIKAAVVRTLKSHVLVTSSHTYGKSLDVRYFGMLGSPACSLVLPLPNTVSMSHRSSLGEDEVRKIKEDVATMHSETRASLETLATVKLRNPDAFFAESMGGARPAAAAANALKTVIKGDTVLAGLHAAAYAIDNVIGYSMDTRLVSAWYGLNRARKERILARALAVS